MATFLSIKLLLKVIKSLGTEQSSDQGQFLPIKILDPCCKHFYSTGDAYVTTPYSSLRQ